jgi:hypothetical protein
MLASLESKEVLALLRGDLSYLVDDLRGGPNSHLLPSLLKTGKSRFYMETDVTSQASEKQLPKFLRVVMIVLLVVCWICWLAAFLLPLSMLGWCGIYRIPALISTLGISKSAVIIIAVVWGVAEIVFWALHSDYLADGGPLGAAIYMVMVPLGGASLVVNTLSSADMLAGCWEKPTAFIATGILAIFSWIYVHVDACWPSERFSRFRTLMVILFYFPACLAVEYFICRFWLSLY